MDVLSLAQEEDCESEFSQARYHLPMTNPFMGEVTIVSSDLLYM